MLWGEIKKAVEAQGVKDDSEVDSFIWNDGDSMMVTPYPNGALAIDGDNDFDDFDDDPDMEEDSDEELDRTLGE